MSTTIELPSGTAAQTPLLGGDILTDDLLCKELKISKRTLFRLNVKRQGPPRLRVGRKIYYRRTSVIQWLEAREEVQRTARTPRRKRA